MNFDDYAAKYKSLCNNLLRFFDSDHEYFLRQKIKLAAKATGSVSANVLDFGCGIGEALPAIRDYFPDSKIFAYDPSEESLRLAREKAPWVHFLDGASLTQNKYDCIIVSCVIHHIPPIEWHAASAQMANLLAPGGWLCIFEHNPWNPVTRRIVNSCPFDADAVLLSKRATIRLLEGCGLGVRRSDYYLFFPSKLRWLRKFEPLIRWLPLGGQYFVGAQQDIEVVANSTGSKNILRQEH